MAATKGGEKLLHTPSNLKSDVWVNFGFEVEFSGTTPKYLNKKVVYCRHCYKDIKYCANTTNLKQHLVRCLAYSKTGKEGNSNTQPGIKGFLLQTKLCSNSKRGKELTAGIVRHLAMDLKPFSTVEGKGFRHMWNVAVPEFVVPPQRTITKEIVSLAVTSRDILKETLEHIGHVSITCDYWTSVAVHAYLGVTCHFITQNWELESYLLGTYQVTERHTADNVAEHVKNVLSEWDISAKTVAVVTDSAANMVSAMRQVDSEHVRCPAHMLQLSIKKGFEIPTVAELLAKGRKLVGHFNQSPSASQKLAAAQAERNLPVKKLVQDVITRWNSTCAMLESVVNNRLAINDVLEDDNRHNYMQISRAEKEKMGELQVLLEPFSEVTTLLGGESYVSSSVVLPTFHFLITKVLNPVAVDSKFLKDVKKKILDDLQERLSLLKGSEALLCASALDPRFKKLSFIDNEAQRSAVWNTLKEKVSLQAASRLEVGLQAGNDDDSNAADDPGPPSKKSLLEDLESVSSGDCNDEEERDEILSYQLEKKIKTTEDPLQWWNVHQNEYVKLSPIARIYLSIPATSVPSERVFSTSGNLVTKNRSRLSGENVNHLTFLHSFLRKEVLRDNCVSTESENR